MDLEALIDEEKRYIAQLKEALKETTDGNIAKKAKNIQVDYIFRKEQYEYYAGILCDKEKDRTYLKKVFDKIFESYRINESNFRLEQKAKPSNRPLADIEKASIYSHAIINILQSLKIKMQDPQHFKIRKADLIQWSASAVREGVGDLYNAYSQITVPYRL